MPHQTKLYRLAGESASWNDRSWFEAERYLLDNTTRLHMQVLLHLVGLKPSGAARYLKTDAVRLLRDIPPSDLLTAWTTLRSSAGSGRR